MAKIDIVYLWCDGNDNEFCKRKNQFLENDNDDINEKASGELRFYDNDELLFSLRSLEKHAPWINHVFIVTDRQIPKWLNLEYEKVTIVDHSVIMPREIIPCFNSDVIEQFIGFIPGLEEKFLYANDDMFFGRDVRPEDFFCGAKPIVRLKQMRKHTVRNIVNNIDNGDEYTYNKPMLNAIGILKSCYGKENFYEMHHNIDAYTVSSFKNTYKKFELFLKETIIYRFRNNNCIQRLLFNLDMVYSGDAVMRIVENPKPWRRRLNFIFPVEWESFVDSENSPKYQKIILKYNPKLFCINSGENCTAVDKLEFRMFIEKLFPQKSKFEK